MKKKVVSGVLSLVTALSITFGAQPKAHAVAVFLEVVNLTTADGRSHVLHANAALFGVAGLITVFFVPPLGAAFLLDNPNNQASVTVDKIQSYGASSEEAKNIYSVFVNAEVSEQKTHAQKVLGDSDFKDAAPNFYGTDGFSKMITDFTSPQAK